MHFAKPDDETFPCMRLCREAIRRGGLYPAAANAANEEANALFREGLIGFTDIPRLVEQALDGPFRTEEGWKMSWRSMPIYATGPGNGPE